MAHFGKLVLEAARAAHEDHAGIAGVVADVDAVLAADVGGSSKESAVVADGVESVATDS